MSKTHLDLGPELEGYLIDCEAERGSREWFVAAFNAVASYAIDNCEYLAEEFHDLFCDEYEDEAYIYEAVEEIKEQAGLGTM